MEHLMKPAIQLITLSPLLSSLLAAWAAAPLTPAHAQTVQKQEAIVVTGNPLASQDLALPNSVLSGERLLLEREGTLGATLSAEPGMASSYFGPNADRPVIRGLDADRIRVLNNSSASVDASSLSFDHAVPIDPLAVTRIEVLRGPAALLYGGSAIGGVVNVLDNRVPRERVEGVTGAVEARYGTAAKSRNGSVLLEAGLAGFVMHVDAFSRKQDNTRIASRQFTQARRDDAQAVIDAGGEASLGGDGEIINSQGRARGAGLGGSVVFADGFAGIAVSDYRSTYGTVAEEAVTIDMKQSNVRAEGEWRKLGGVVDAVRVKAINTRYKHTELDDGEPATDFNSKGHDVRLELQHTKLGALQGVVGVQTEASRFSALGAEAFVPRTRSKVDALFAYEEAQLGALLLNFGMRHERNRVRSLGEDSDNPDDDRFGDAKQRRFNLTSLAAGGNFALTPQWSVGAQLARSERAPTFYELYSDGEHAATGNYELGDPLLAKEKSNSVELSLRFKQSNTSSRLSVYQTRFSNYIGLFDSGNRFQEDEDGDGVFDIDLPIFNFIAVPAKFNGAEWEGRVRVSESPYTLDLTAQWDVVRAMNTRTGEPLPRIAPMRAGVGAEYRIGPWSAGINVLHHARPKVPAGEFRSDSYTQVTANVGWRFNAGQANGLIFARLTNLTNEEARPATSLLREITPLAKRSAELGVRLAF
jgi:iron complex outermembrane receptor protein